MQKSGIRVSKTAWPLVFPYAFADWGTLNQLEEGTYIDLLGIVSDPPAFVPAGKLRKANLVVENGPYAQVISLLGSQASLEVQKKATISRSLA